MNNANLNEGNEGPQRRHNRQYNSRRRRFLGNVNALHFPRVLRQFRCYHSHEEAGHLRSVAGSTSQVRPTCFDYVNRELSVTLSRRGNMLRTAYPIGRTVLAAWLIALLPG